MRLHQVCLKHNHLSYFILKNWQLVFPYNLSEIGLLPVTHFRLDLEHTPVSLI